MYVNWFKRFKAVISIISVKERSRRCYGRGIARSWEKVVENDGKYFD